VVVAVKVKTVALVVAVEVITLLAQVAAEVALVDLVVLLVLE
jgi:hypothetical protein